MMPPSTSTLISTRAAGWMYLAVIALGLFGEAFVRGTLVVSGDATATATRVLASESLWRAGIAGDLLMQVLDVPLIVFFYLLLKPVSRRLALLATLFNVVQTCTLVANKSTLVTALMLLRAAADGRLPPESKVLALLAIDLHSHGFAIGLIFFGLACIVRGHLILRSGYVPKALGVLLGLAGISYLLNSLALLLSPPLAAALFPAVLLPALVGELALCAWLLLADPVRLRHAMAARRADSGSATSRP